LVVTLQIFNESLNSLIHVLIMTSSSALSSLFALMLLFNSLFLSFWASICFFRSLIVLGAISSISNNSSSISLLSLSSNLDVETDLPLNSLFSLILVSDTALEWLNWSNLELREIAEMGLMFF